MKKQLHNQAWELNINSDELYEEKWLSYGKIKEGRVKSIICIIPNKGIQNRRDKLDKSKWNQFNLYEDKL